MKDARQDEPGAGGARADRPGWGDLLKSLLAVHVARAAQRVRSQRAAQPETGRLGGEASSAAPGLALPARRARDEEKPRVESQAAAEDPTTVPKGAWPIARFVFTEFGKDNGTLMAAAVAFYLLLSLIPLLAVAVAVLGYVLGSSNRAVDQVFLFLNQLLPVQKSEIHEVIQGIVRGKGTIGLFGLLGLALTATGGFATLENAINVMWNRPNRSFLMNKLYAVGMMLGVGSLFALSVGITSIMGWAGRIPGLEWLTANWTLQVLGYVLPVLITGLMFALIYRIYPNGRSGWRSSLTAGFITALLWEAFKLAYTLYTRSGDQSVYGVAIGLVMWIFYSCSLVLLGSELTWVLEGCPGREGKDAAQAQRGR